MKAVKRILRCVMAFVLVFTSRALPASALDLYIPGSIDGSAGNLQYYAEATKLISEFWEDDYFDTLYYSEGDGACMIDGEWYLAASEFCGDAGINYSRKGKKFTISSNEFKWECKVNKKTSSLNGEKYIFENKPVKKNGTYMINADELAENSCYEIRSTGNGVSVSSPFQLKRLIVEVKKGKKFFPEFYGAIRSVTDGETYILQFETEKATKAAYEKLSGSKKIVYVEPDKLIYADPIPDSISLGGAPSGNKKTSGTKNKSISGYYDSSDWNVRMLGADELAERINEAGINRSVTVAVVDTGIDYTHTYLKSNVISKGYDFINSDSDAYDDNGHGTHVAGIIVNTASGANVSLLPVKVLSGQGYGSSVAVANGILYAAEAGADVINLSLGGASYGTGHYEDNAISKAMALGSVIVVAAGNDNSDTAYECPAHNNDAIVVAAIDSDYDRAYFSNYGYSVDVAAPGVNILSSVPGNAYEYMSGTSMATPHVSGLAALIRLIRPGLSCSKTKEILHSCAVDLGTSGFDIYYGYGVPYVADLEIDPSQDAEITGYPIVPTPTPVITGYPTVPTPTPVITGYPSDPTPSPVITWYPWDPVFPTFTPIITGYPIQPTITPIITGYPGWPTTTPTPVITGYPILPTPTPTPIITGYPILPTPTPTPIITGYPVQPTPTPNPGNYGSTACNISTSSSYSNNVGTLNISIVTGTGVKNVIVTLSDGSRYEYVNSGTGIVQNLSFSGNMLSVTIKAYDYYGNMVYLGNAS